MHASSGLRIAMHTRSTVTPGRLAWSCSARNLAYDRRRRPATRHPTYARPIAISVSRPIAAQNVAPCPFPSAIALTTVSAVQTVAAVTATSTRTYAAVPLRLALMGSHASLQMHVHFVQPTTERASTRWVLERVALGRISSLTLPEPYRAVGYIPDVLADLNCPNKGNPAVIRTPGHGTLDGAPPVSDSAQAG
jgi:hypothetical protein